MVPFLNLRVADVMSPDPVSITPQTTLAKLRELFETLEYNALPVVEGDSLVGMVTQFDLLKSFLLSHDSIMPHYDEILARPVEEIMVRSPDTVNPDQALNRTLRHMVETRNKSFPVVEDGRLVGMIAREDFFKGLKQDMQGAG